MWFRTGLLLIVLNVRIDLIVVILMILCLMLSFFRVDSCSTSDPIERPIRSLFFCKLWTTTTCSKMGQIDDAVTYLKAQDVPNYAAVVKIYNIQPTTLRRRFLGLSTSRTATSAEHHQLFNTNQKNVFLNYIDRMTTQHISPTPQIV